jgi:hypothetical protein
MIYNMKAKLVYEDIKDIESGGFVEMVVWAVPSPVQGSAHGYKYRFAYVLDGECVLRYDNEAGKGDHKHVGKREIPYKFASVPQLLADFMNDVKKWKE